MEPLGKAIAKPSSKAAPKAGTTKAAHPAVKKSRKKAEEAEVSFYESYDLHGETYSVGDDGEPP